MITTEHSLSYQLLTYNKNQNKSSKSSIILNQIENRSFYVSYYNLFSPTYNQNTNSPSLSIALLHPSRYASFTAKFLSYLLTLYYR